MLLRHALTDGICAVLVIINLAAAVTITSSGNNQHMAGEALKAIVIAYVLLIAILVIYVV